MTEPGPAVDRDHTEEPDRVVIRDKRRIDPVTGAVRDISPAEARAGERSEEAEANVPKAQALLVEERTRDLQRVQAEYANYRKRAERDRLAAADSGVGRVLAELVPVLDDIDRAASHGDLTGGLKAVADHLDTVLTKIGLERFGEVGEPFNPALHEAVMHAESDDVTQPTCTSVLRPGYRYRERLLRPAMVGVTEPPAPATPSTDPEIETPERAETLDGDASPMQEADEAAEADYPATPGEPGERAD
jgi:molecular chaperone GrpE